MTSVFAAAAVLFLAAPLRAQTATIRIGHFPNITHVQALVAHALSRANNGWFEQRLGPDVKIEWYVYNAGPSAMEAIFAKSIDLTYVGPNPAINAYAKSRGEEVRIVAGAADGGSALVVRGDSTLKTPADFRGKKIATPQFGNTQDVAARAWLVAGGLAIRQSGGDAQVLPAANPDQLSLFQQKQVDAVWTVEPWVSRLELEAKGRVLIDDRSAITTVLVARVDYLRSQRDLVRKIVAAHAELTDWIKVNPAEAQKLAAAELLAETRATMSQQPIERSWPRIMRPRACRSMRSRSFSRARRRDSARHTDLSRPSRSLDASRPVFCGKRAREIVGRIPSPRERTGARHGSRARRHRPAGQGRRIRLPGRGRGCGKSTPLDIVAGLTMPDSGRVLADDQVVAGPGRHRLVMFQESALFPWLTVFGNVQFGLKRIPGMRRRERQDIADRYLELVGLMKFKHSYVHELSGGMRQRVALARSLAPDPRVLLMDEPFAALDALTREHLYRDVQRIWQRRRKTIIMVTHNVREAVCLADRVILLSPNPGRIREQFEIDLPRPRNINSPQLAEIAQRITADLMAYLPEEFA